MEILHSNIPYMKMPVLIFIEITECNEMCSPPMEVQVFEDVLCSLPFYCTSDFG